MTKPKCPSRLAFTVRETLVDATSWELCGINSRHAWLSRHVLGLSVCEVIADSTLDLCVHPTGDFYASVATCSQYECHVQG